MKNVYKKNGQLTIKNKAFQCKQSNIKEPRKAMEIKLQRFQMLRLPDIDYNTTIFIMYKNMKDNSEKISLRIGIM